MYGYKTRHLILDAFMKKQHEHGEPTSILKTSSKGFIKSFKKRQNKIEGYVVCLADEGYLKFHPTDTSDLLLSITKEGVSARAGEYFKIKHREALWKSIMNITITISNAIVAAAAIWALTKDSGEVQRIEERVKILEESGQTKGVKSNPNMTAPKNGHLTTPIDDSSKKSYDYVPFPK